MRHFAIADGLIAFRRLRHDIRRFCCRLPPLRQPPLSIFAAMRRRRHDAMPLRRHAICRHYAIATLCCL